MSQPIRRIPNISEDGASLSTHNSETFNNNSFMIYGVYGYEAHEILAACSAPPYRLLLDYQHTTTSDKSSRILIGCISHALLACVIGVLISSFLPKFIALPISLLLTIGLILRAAWIEYWKPNPRQRTEWLDFKTRNRYQRIEYFDGLPTQTQYIPLDGLILVCFHNHLGDGEETETIYIVGLCETAELATLRTGRYPSLINKLHIAHTEDPAIALTQDLAQLWNIPGWRGYLAGGRSPHVQKLHIPNPFL